MIRLHQIAADMRRMVDLPDARYVHRTLSRGLELVLQRKERQYRLALGRTDRPPSDLEVRICAEAFAVPPDTEPQRTVKERSGKLGPQRVHVAELYWSEVQS